MLFSPEQASECCIREQHYKSNGKEPEVGPNVLIVIMAKEARATNQRGGTQFIGQIQTWIQVVLVDQVVVDQRPLLGEVVGGDR